MKCHKFVYAAALFLPGILMMSEPAAHRLATRSPSPGLPRNTPPETHESYLHAPGHYPSLRTEHYAPVPAGSPAARARLDGDWLRHFRTMQFADRQLGHALRDHDRPTAPGPASLRHGFGAWAAAIRELDHASQRTGLRRDEILRVARVHGLLEERELVFLANQFRRTRVNSGHLYRMVRHERMPNGRFETVHGPPDKNGDVY